MPIPYVALKALRIARLLRIFRYMKAFSILSRAFRSKTNEMKVSLQFLAIVTLILSFVLFFVEHEAQPEVYDNGWTSVIWAFAQYIGDPGNFADTPPITFTGRIIACIIGILGIAIFAVPAGLIGSAFTEVMEKDEKKEKIDGWKERLHLAFERKLDRPTGLQIAPKYVSITEIQARLGLKEDEILDAVSNDDNYRLINLSVTQPADEHPQDKLAVEHFPLNAVYGQCIDRGSKITIFAPSNTVDPIMGWWAYYVALIGGFNYISKELGITRPYQSFYTYSPEKKYPHNQEFMDDMNRLANTTDSWIFSLMPASGSQEPTYPTQFHFTYGAKKGDETYDDPNITLNDIPTFDALYKEFQKLLETKYDLQSDCQRYHTNAAKNYFARHLNTKVNAIALRIAWSVTCWDMRAIQIAQDFAQIINQHINHCDNPEVPALKTKDIGYNGY
jgi:voltage-gated potassium channel